jgi:hypothetical protein
MKTLLTAAAAAAALAVAALPVAAQSWDHGYRSVPVQTRFIDHRFERDVAWRSWQARELERRIEEQRRIEWLRHHHRAFIYNSGYGSYR